jgi:hypothetical protein
VKRGDKDKKRKDFVSQNDSVIQNQKEKER